ncbi:photosystem II protein PsbQ [Allocoleopsis franciscana]|uniref:Photosystem II protein PsbQ n=1 Tax=Allocoleopsis franciscana PCC 7113 TaxID=1173027 RepID=K9WEM2_9CYAN|nr:photosystem II protein PsbQ [Allocoleopsis franciscana]AFZ18251.1 photosystem II protein PsbQ [Allocoleopsis franciscana PCC 7113]
MLRKSYRSLLAVMLTLVMTLLVSCSSPTVTKPPTYTPDKIAQIQKYASTVTDLRETMPTLATSIQNRNWTEVGSFIHGPLGELRQKMSYLTRELLPQDQKAAREAAQDLFTRLESIDLATESGNYQKAVDNYRLAIKDFDAFLQLIPE